MEKSFMLEVAQQYAPDAQRASALAKERGVYQGRKPIDIDKEAFETVYAEVVRKERTNKYAMQKLGLKPNTYYKAVKEYKEKTGRWGE